MPVRLEPWRFEASFILQNVSSFKEVGSCALLLTCTIILFKLGLEALSLQVRGKYGQEAHLYLRLWLKQSPGDGKHPDTSKMCIVQMIDKNFVSLLFSFWSLQSVRLLQLRGSFRMSWLSVPQVGRHSRNHQTKPAVSSPFLSVCDLYRARTLSLQPEFLLSGLQSTRWQSWRFA